MGETMKRNARANKTYEKNLDQLKKVFKKRQSTHNSQKRDYNASFMVPVLQNMGAIDQ